MFHQFFFSLSLSAITWQKFVLGIHCDKIVPKNIVKKIINKWDEIDVKNSSSQSHDYDPDWIKEQDQNEGQGRRVLQGRRQDLA